MVEGHQCHRVAAAHRKMLLNRCFTATSPNGRFSAGAAAITGKSLTQIEVHGKNLFYFFRQPDSLQRMHEIMHVHFGMAGAFKTFRAPGESPTETTRLRLENKELGILAHLSAMTVNHGNDEYYRCGACCIGTFMRAAMCHTHPTALCTCTKHGRAIFASNMKYLGS
jgi:formamidopyrimidine-DNA glycosylase